MSETATTISPVCSWNEWDPLEEVIVGTAWGAHMPGMSDPLSENALRGFGGQPFPVELIFRVQTQLERFVKILTDEE